MFEVTQKQIILNQKIPQLKIIWNWTKTAGNVKFCCFRLDVKELFQNRCYTLNDLEQYFLEKCVNQEKITLDNIEDIATRYAGQHPQDIVRTQIFPARGMKIYGISSPISLSEMFYGAVAVIYMYDDEHIDKFNVSFWEDNPLGFQLKLEYPRKWFKCLQKKFCYRLELTENDNRPKVMKYKKGGQEYKVILPPSDEGIYYLPNRQELTQEYIHISYLMFD